MPAAEEEEDAADAGRDHRHDDEDHHHEGHDLGHAPPAEGVAHHRHRDDARGGVGEALQEAGDEQGVEARGDEAAEGGEGIDGEADEEHGLAAEPVAQGSVEELAEGEADDVARQDELLAVGVGDAELLAHLRQRREHHVDRERGQRHQRRDQRDELGETRQGPRRRGGGGLGHGREVRGWDRPGCYSARAGADQGGGPRKAADSRPAPPSLPGAPRPLRGGGRVRILAPGFSETTGGVGVPPDPTSRQPRRGAEGGEDIRERRQCLPGAPRRVARDPQQRVPHAARPLGVREDDALAPDRRVRASDARAHPARRRGVPRRPRRGIRRFERRSPAFAGSAPRPTACALAPLSPGGAKVARGGPSPAPLDPPGTAR